MFQTFEVSSQPKQGPPRLKALRAVMAQQGFAAWLTPRADAHQGEYVADCDARLSWLTGFTGSAGFAVCLQDQAGVFVDGRYRVQVRSEVDTDVFTPVDWPETSLSDWLIGALPEGGKVGFDPWLHTITQMQELRKAFANGALEMTASDNLVDQIWTDRPAPPAEAFTARPDALAGESHADKRARIAGALRDAGQNCAVFSSPDSIAWLLNIRGSDIPFNPVPLAFAVLHDTGAVELFCLPGKASAIAAHLGPEVTAHDLAGFAAALGALTGTVRLDPATAPEQFRLLINADIAENPDPVLLPKARKNAAELAGMRAAHLRDGAAMTRFLAWLAEEAPKGGLTEIDVVKALEGFRRQTNLLLDVSFETISGAGEHGAIVHYRVNEQTNSPVRAGELLLVDSGGQYNDGTTDITRTMAIGPAPQGAAQDYTRVLQGMIAISRARFPKGVTGGHLDALARFPLWCAGMDYDHGTGHGVGAYLCVHEGPQGISRRSNVPLEPGMVLSNEPGHYRPGKWGIRIENLIAVHIATPIEGGDDREMQAFETLTWVPFERALIDTALLSQPERDWVNDYHGQTLTKIAPLVNGSALAWLTSACAPL